MKGAFYLLLVVVGLLMTSIVLILYPSEPQIVNCANNITFKSGTRKIGDSFQREQAIDMIAKKMDDRLYHQSIIVGNNRFKVDYNTLGKSGVKSFVSGNLSISTGMQNVQNIALNNGNIAQYKQYALSQELTPAFVNMTNFQHLQISSHGRHSHGGDIIEVGNKMGAECSHTNIGFTENGLICNDCGATGKLEEVGPGGSVGSGSGITWVPLGDVILPMLMMVLGYLLVIFMKRD